MTDTRAVSPATWLGFGAMCLGMFMAILDIQVVVTSLPTIRAALGIAPDLMSWVQTAYLIAEVIAIPLTGVLSRVLTLRGLFAAALSVFTLASIACAASGSFEALIAWRVVQGFAGGVLIPLVFSAVFLLFPFALQSLATTIGGVLAVLAPTVGPLVGGWITETWSWPWVFLINVPPGILAVAVALRSLAVEKPAFGHARTLDWLSLGLMALALACLEIGLKEAPEHGWTSGLVLGLFAVLAASGAIFVRRTLSAGQPVVHLRTLADRDFAVGCWLSFILGTGLFGSTYLMPVFLAFVRGHGALRIGEIMLVTGVAELVTAPIVVYLGRRVDARLLTACGFGLFALGLGLSYFETRETDFEEMVLPQLLRGGSIMLCLLPPTVLALGHLPPARVADASGLFNLMRNLGGAIGLALIDTVIYSRAPVHAEALVERLKAGDVEAARSIGLPAGLVTGQPVETITPEMEALVRPLIEKVSLVSAINEAWAMLAGLMILGLLALPIATRQHAREQIERRAETRVAE
ncbi:MAG: DHA2 family efflux MFS transporter permease subunit [Burkholderiales bacterium]